MPVKLPDEAETLGHGVTGRDGEELAAGSVHRHCNNTCLPGLGSKAFNGISINFQIHLSISSLFFSVGTVLKCLKPDLKLLCQVRSNFLKMRQVFDNSYLPEFREFRYPARLDWDS